MHSTIRVSDYCSVSGSNSARITIFPLDLYNKGSMNGNQKFVLYSGENSSGQKPRVDSRITRFSLGLSPGKTRIENRFSPLISQKCFNSNQFAEYRCDIET